MAVHGRMWHRVTRGIQCSGLDAAGCQADLHLLAASWQGSGVSAGASAPGSGTPACASWVEPCVIVRLMFSKAGLHLASGGGTGYSSIHSVLTCDPFTGGIRVELLLVVLASARSQCWAEGWQPHVHCSLQQGTSQWGERGGCALPQPPMVEIQEPMVGLLILSMGATGESQGPLRSPYPLSKQNRQLL